MSFWSLSFWYQGLILPRCSLYRIISPLSMLPRLRCTSSSVVKSRSCLFERLYELRSGGKWRSVKSPHSLPSFEPPKTLLSSCRIDSLHPSPVPSRDSCLDASGNETRASPQLTRPTSGCLLCSLKLPPSLLPSSRSGHLFPHTPRCSTYS